MVVPVSLNRLQVVVVVDGVRGVAALATPLTLVLVRLVLQVVSFQDASLPKNNSFPQTNSPIPSSVVVVVVVVVAGDRLYVH